MFLLVLLPFVVHAQDSSVTVCHEQARLGRFFDAHAAVGTFLLLDLRADTAVCFGKDRLNERNLPASTFKIFNSMAALDAGAIADETTVLKWDGIDRGNAGWNQDQDMRTAFRNSTVWFYQELARRIGEQRMQEFVRREHYGNEEISGGIDRFWLGGGLRISVTEQVEFVRKVYLHRLGFSERAQCIVNDIMLLEQGSAGTLRAKTGWTEERGEQVGWFVGYIERQRDVFLFAMKLASMDVAFPMRQARAEILRDLLRDCGMGEWHL